MADEDRDILDSYLDGALSPEAADRVRQRLERDPAFVAAVDQLRAERATRHAAWQSFEPDPAFATGAASVAFSAALRQDRYARASRFARRASAVAAGVVIAFAGGWAARGRVSVPAPHPVAPTEFQVALTDEGGRIIAVQAFADPHQARQFAEDVGRWQSGRDDDSSGDFSQVSDEF